MTVSERFPEISGSFGQRAAKDLHGVVPDAVDGHVKRDTHGGDVPGFEALGQGRAGII